MVFEYIDKDLDRQIKVGLVTDSTSDIDFDMARENQIEVVPLTVSFNGQDHLEDEFFDFDGYYQNFVTQDLFRVTTTLPSPARFQNHFQNLINKGCTHIICYTVSSGLSGTYNSAILAKNALEEEGDIRIEVIDTHSVSVGELYYIESAIELIRSNSSFEHIVKQTSELYREFVTILLLPTLKYLKASGRVSTPRFLLGNLLGLKPITMMVDGANQAISTVRNMEKGVDKLYALSMENLSKPPEVVSIVHTNDLTLVNKMKGLITKNHPNAEIRVLRVRSSLSAHTGPGAIGLIIR
ncbi:MAG: DegV family protein [Candidatus Heimdallarchaeota archaeon]|nr:DegV family protein [Candidatus Heimdallarchaeota archaeon]